MSLFSRDPFVTVEPAAPRTPAVESNQNPWASGGPRPPNTPNQPQEPVRKRSEGPKINAPAGILLVAYMLVAAGVTYHRTVGGPGVPEGTAVGALIGAFVGTFIFASIFFWISGRRQVVFNSAVGIIAVLGAIGISLPPNTPRFSPATAHALNNLKSEVDSLKNEATSQLQRGEMYTQTTEQAKEHYARVKEKLNTAAATADPQTAQLMRASSRLMSSINEIAAKAHEIDEEVGELGGILPISIKSRSALQERIALSAKLVDAQVECVKWLDDAEIHIRAELTREGIPLSVLDRVVRDYMRGAKIETLRDINRHSLDNAKHILNILNFLDEHWGQWKPTEEWVAFSTQEQARGFDRCVALLTDSINAVALAQARHFGMNKDEVTPTLFPAATVLPTTTNPAGQAAKSVSPASKPRW